MLQISENSSPVEVFAAARAALEALPSSKRLSADEAEGLYAMVHRTILQGKYEAALKYLSVLTFLKPTEPRYLSALALTYKHLDQPLEALKVYSFLALLEPAEMLHPLSVAECHLQLREPDQAWPLLAFVLDSTQGVAGAEKLHDRAQALLNLSTQGAVTA